MEAEEGGVRRCEGNAHLTAEGGRGIDGDNRGRRMENEGRGGRMMELAMGLGGEEGDGMTDRVTLTHEDYDNGWGQS
ncbi:hypothetical protein CBR_g26032 [Chara braunii]|uniref:Uncharacterized protein n=1 Tax=Chara braunii TaxID=69332 RepID=A0A388L716_CHABU|nr:hypothetical protein CBR_g26032 [Chara braunii]|eukprot:GBG78095.1 hypothetical protein CBR_g26032 [Chara braunii]